MNDLFCQSCGMPLDNEEVFATNTDGSKNEDFCIHCFKGGSYISDVTMDEMIEISRVHMTELFKDDSTYNEQAAVDNMKNFFPNLKRWKSVV